MKRRLLKLLTVVLLVITAFILLAPPVSAAIGGGVGSVDPNLENPGISVNINGEGSDAVRIILLMTVLTLLPSVLIMMTCFTRIVVIFSLLRNAIGLQQTPPNQVLIGLALFLSLFIMQPVISDINQNAYKPFSEDEISTQEFVDRAVVPLKAFMQKQTLKDDTNLFLSISKEPVPEDPSDYPMAVVVPAFMTSELKRAFTAGFFLFIPFLIIDMVVSSALMSMGMMMLPPVTISLPFKLMLFVLVDGWGWLIKTIVSTYQF